MAKVSNAALDAMLNAIAAGTPMNTALYLGLFSNNIPFDADTTLGMLTEATYSGYSRSSLTGWTGASGGTGGTSTNPNSTALFLPGTLGSPQDCYGWFVVDAANDVVMGGNFVGGPLNMGGVITSLSITPSLTLSS